MNTITEPRSITTEQRAEILRQIGVANRASIDGLRPAIPTARGVELVCGYGYRVRITLEPRDLYTVERVYRQGAREWVKGAQTDVYYTELPEVAHRAGMFRDEWV